MAKKEIVVGLNDMDMTNDDLFIRKSCNNLDKKAQVIVEETHSAILIKDGEMINTLSAGKYDIFDKKDKDVSKVDIIYLSKTAKLKACWGTLNKLIVKDSETGIATEVGANGEYEVQVGDPRKFYLELVGADKNFNLEKLKDRLQGRILSEIEPIVARVIKEKNLSYHELGENKNIIADEIFGVVAELFERNYGLKLYSFIISKIFVSEESIAKIEKALKDKKLEEKEEKTAKDLASEIEKLGDKNFEKEIILKKLETANYEKYLEVCKLLGWEPKEKAEATFKYCPECGCRCESDSKFCTKCGKELK